MPVRLAVVEDDVPIGEATSDALRSHGYSVDWYRTGAAATPSFEDDPPDLVLLDVGLPDVDGFSLCRWLRDSYPEMPILLVTARDSEIDTIVGLDSGATDYVTKPFSMNVLLARVRAHLRTTEKRDENSPITLGRVVVDPDGYRATLDGTPVELRPREFELLLALARANGRVATRESLLETIWGMRWDSPSKTLETHVLALRRKFGDALPVTTVRGVGYRLDAE